MKARLSQRRSPNEPSAHEKKRQHERSFYKISVKTIFREISVQDLWENIGAPVSELPTSLLLLLHSL